ncbi:Hypothetical predicted protein [Mytilus galloprovincialis]|uniref:C-type lectin domain-containing protein n=1 Tax=Mytilus galloprovincialis TaxID=29158 RepID=A0A8B6E5J2_MYTGA|nr:Hypothetical predicted protein [Mytilus galloprovincialis]
MLKLIVYSFVLTTIFKAFEVSACDHGWTQFEQSCYYSSAIIGNVFQVRHRHKHWFGAQAECEGKGAKLAELNTESELQFVRQLAQKRHKSVWIGGTDGDKEGTVDVGIWYTNISQRLQTCNRSTYETIRSSRTTRLSCYCWWALERS